MKEHRIKAYLVILLLVFFATPIGAQVTPGTQVYGQLAIGNIATVTNSVGHWSATAVLTPGVVTTGAKVATTMTFPGASFVATGGYLAYCGASGTAGVAAASPGVIIINAFVNGATTVSVEFANQGAGSVTPTSQGYRCDVWYNLP